jgi:tRNA A-37 threonylcarbamoyl transferase component Bud32
MTWASKSFSGTVAQTRVFLTKQVWAWPIVAVSLLLVIGWAVNGAVERTMNANLQSQLQTLLDVEVAMLRNWLSTQENNALNAAGDIDVRRLAVEMLDQSDSADVSDPTDHTEQLERALRSTMKSHDYENFVVTDREKVIASSRSEAINMELPAELAARFDRVFDGKPTVTRPFRSRLSYVDTDGQVRAGVPMMYAMAPIVDEQLHVAAILGLQIRPENEFTRILQLGRLGESGETYAFDSNGLMLSNSRFDRELTLEGLLQEGSPSILNLLVRNPGGDITAGFRPGTLRSELPLTQMVEEARQGRSGVDVSGYRDYRGVQVVGAWTWLDEYGFGVATEIDFAEAFQPLTILKRTFWSLLALLAASSAAIFVFSLKVARAQRQAREAAIEAKELGQYRLEEKLGEGSMGVVYKGRHAMLRRPTAIKLLNTDRITDQSISRFEREVQITSNLNHPNTIAIYDFGRTPEDVFYYAMEFLDGIDLQQLVEAYGPQSAGRVIHILKQVCGSLYEAHCAGLVHRDVKPANIMLNRRGGEGDVVKVLDFGLVMAREENRHSKEVETMAGTPLYMSPEAIQFPNSVDACSDLYAVGMVGYYLLTGHPAFEADSLAELCQMQAAEVPEPPSSRLGKPVPPQLEHAVLACLEKSRAKRPQTARDLAKLLDGCPAAAEWTLDLADAWWSSHERGQGANKTQSTVAQANDATVMFE